jgi:hypothetical protein
MVQAVEFRFGIWERLAGVTFLVSVLAVGASLTLPPSVQENLAQSGLGPVIFWISIVGVLAATLFFICDFAHYILRKLGASVGTALAIIGTALIIIGTSVGLVGAFKTDAELTKSKGPKLTDAPPLLSMFMEMLRPKIGMTVFGYEDINLPTIQARVFYNLQLDFTSQTKYISLYIPPHPNLAAVISELDPAEIAEQAGNTVRVGAHARGNTTEVNSKDYLFSGAVYIFHEDQLTRQQILDFTDGFKKRRMSVQFYSTEFKLIEWDQMKLGNIPKLPSYVIVDNMVQLARD